MNLKNLVTKELTDEERKILDTFAMVIPNLTEKEKDRLLYIGEGMALKTENLILGFNE